MSGEIENADLQDDSGTIWDIKSMFILGILLMILGGVMVVLSWPEMVMTSAGYSSEIPELNMEPAFKEEGSGLGVAFGGAVAFVGQIFVGIGIIASGVRIGMDTKSRVATPVP
jgi:hypothetical protein